MTQTIKALDLIRRSMYLINALAAGEIPSDMDANDALITLNEMVDGLNIQPLAPYQADNLTLSTSPGKRIYLIGPTAIAPDFPVARPNFVLGATCIRQDVTTPVLVISQTEYDRIALKDLEQPIMERLLYVNTFPNGTITLYPVPSEVVTLELNIGYQITGPVTLQSTIALPPGYQEMLRYNLAVRLWPEYTNPSTDIESIKAMATRTLGYVKKANQDMSVANFDDIPQVDAVGRSWDWRMG